MAQLVRAPPCHGGGRGFESHSGRCNICGILLVRIDRKSFLSSLLLIAIIGDLSSAGRASALQAEGHRFEPCRSHLYVIEFADVAQLAEQLTCNQQVIGSSPIVGLRMDSRAAKGGRL